MPDPDFLFGPTPHDEAIDFIKSKPVVSRDVFNGLLPELKARAFTVAGIEGANVLQRVRDRIADLPAGHRWDDIKKDIVGDISPFIVDPDASPEHRDGQINAANRRAELLLRTHGFQAYQAASYDVMDRQRDVLPYWQYLTMEDDRVRPEHAALDQLVLPADSPFWQGHYPPWDFGCRCQVVPISQEDRDDIQDQDKKKAPDCQRVLEGPQATHLVHGQLMREGRAYDVRTPREKQGNDAYGWHPGDLRLSLDQLRGRYDGPTFAAFEAWARQTALNEGGAKTVWAWLGGTMAGAPPAPAAAAVAMPVAHLIDKLQHMHAQHGAIRTQIQETYAQWRQEISGAPASDVDPINARYEPMLSDLAGKAELVLAQQRNFIRAPVGDRSALPVTNHSRAGLIRKLEDGLALWRSYAAAAIDVSAPMPIFALRQGARAYCDGQGLHLGPGTSASTVMHEIAHWIDRAHPAVARANLKFLDRRTAGEVPQQLRKLTGNKGYGVDEVAKPDKFYHPYVGKIYSQGASEILSMGIEKLHENPGLFAVEDADYCEHVLKMLRGETGP